MTKLLIQGIGGIGGYLSYNLINAGYDCTLITGNEKITDVIKQKGLTILPENRNIRVNKVFTSLNEVDEKYDIALLIMKSQSAIESGKNSIALLNDKGFIVAMQNGIIEDKMAKEIGGYEKIVSASVGWGGTMIEHGIYEKTTGGKFHIGELDGKITPRIKLLQIILNSAVETQITSNIRGVLWSKLAINCTVTTLGAITGKTLGEMHNIKGVNNILLDCYQEVIDVAHENRIKLEKIASNPYLLYRKKNAGIFTQLFKKLIVFIMAKKYGGTRSSSLQSLERGRPTEIDYLNGYVINNAMSVNVPTNKIMYSLVKEIENGTRKISVDNLKEFSN